MSGTYAHEIWLSCRTDWRDRPTSVFLFFCLVLAVIGFGVDAWSRPLNADERDYYAPAIGFVSARLPVLPLADYPFPGPPLALWMQSLIAKGCNNLLSVRLFSTACAVLLAAYLLLFSGSRSFLQTMGLLGILTFPYFLWNTFTIKQHVFTVACLVIGLDQLRKGEARASSWSPCGWLSAAALSNQFCAPACLAILGEYLLRLRTGQRIEPFRIAVIVVPLAALGVLMCLWGGKQPPGYVDPLPLRSFRWQTPIAQTMLGLISVGVWAAGLSLSWREHFRWFAIAFVPSLLAIHYSGLYSPEGDFWTTGQGPVSTCLMILLGGSALGLNLAAAVLAALGCAFIVAPPVAAPWTIRCRLLIGIYLSVAALGVPYLFESYYLLLIVPLLFVIASGNTSTERVKRRVVQLAGSITFGIAYSVLKLKAVS